MRATPPSGKAGFARKAAPGHARSLRSRRLKRKLSKRVIKTLHIDSLGCRPFSPSLRRGRAPEKGFEQLMRYVL